MFIWFVPVAAMILFGDTVIADGNTKEFCERKWPTLELFLPVGLSHKADERSANSRNEEWQWCFLSSFMMFWPAKLSNTSILLMVDDEVKNSTLKLNHVDHVLEQLKLRGGPNLPPIDVKYHVKPMEYNSGHDRQQHMMFYADEYTTAEYVGFVDTDTMFYTALDREDIFEDNKPVVHGKIGVTVPFHWPRATYLAMGFEETMNCMSYFPVVIKTAHLKPLREHIANHYKVPFDQAFKMFAGSKKASFSQFNFMCAYMWQYQRAEYTWRINDVSPKWDGINNPKPQWGQWSERYIFGAEMFTPKPFVSLHARYYSQYSLFDLGEKMVYVRGICHGEPETNVLGLNCTEYLRTHTYFDEMHIFEGNDFTKIGNLTWMIEVQRERTERLKGCDKSYGHHEMLRVFGPLDETSRAKYQKMLPLKSGDGHFFARRRLL